MLKELKRNKQLYLMCIPALLLLLFLAYVPMVGIWMAFTDYNLKDGIFGSEFVGLRWFKYFFTNPTGMGLKVVKNTLVINFWGLILGTIIPITIAICFNEIRGKLFKKLTQSAMFFPYFLSTSCFVISSSTFRLRPSKSIVPQIESDTRDSVILFASTINHNGSFLVVYHDHALERVWYLHPMV